MKNVWALATLIIVIAPSICLAQDTKKIPVAVSHFGKDSLGQSVAFALKDAIRGSHLFRLVDDELMPRTPRIVVSLVTQGDDKTSAMAVVILYESLETWPFPPHLHHFVQTCSQDKIKDCSDILSIVDRQVEALRKLRPEWWKTLTA